jgi:hypothetical protein
LRIAGTRMTGESMGSAERAANAVCPHPLPARGRGVHRA